METIKQDIEQILLIKEQLKSEQLEKIDFDKLILQLENINELYVSYQTLHNEFQQLQDNLIQKISVMQKATLVVTKKRARGKELDSDLARLSELNSKELLYQFEKTESKFHRAFPSTFPKVNHNKNNLKDYKSYK